LYACYINEGNIQKPLLAIFSRRDIEPFEEICFNYQGIYDDSDDEDDEDDDGKLLDPDHGKDMIYVRCQCGAKNCTGNFFLVVLLVICAQVADPCPFLKARCSNKENAHRSCL
jgi:[histone H3]-lysine9 N-trimethyltransferase SUV39H